MEGGPSASPAPKSAASIEPCNVPLSLRAGKSAVGGSAREVRMADAEAQQKLSAAEQDGTTRDLQSSWIMGIIQSIGGGQAPADALAGEKLA